MSGALRVLAALFDVDTATATKRVEEFNGKLGQAKQVLGSVAGALATTFAVGKVVDFVQEQIDLGDALVDTSQKLGVGTDELQRFQYGAGLAGVSADSAAKALGFLNKNMGEALDGGAAQAQAFAKFGVSLKNADGSVRSLQDVIPELADGFQGMGSQQERTAAAMTLFGRSGAELLPFLQQGSDAVREMGKEFELLGGGMNKDFLEQADKAGDEIYRMKFAFGGLKTQLALGILPALNGVLTKFTRFVAYVRNVVKETHIAKYAFQLFGAIAAASGVKAALGIAKVLNIVPKGAGFWRSVLGLGVWGLVLAAVVALALVLEDLWVGIQGGQSLIRDFLDETLGVEESTAFFEQLRGVVDSVSGSFSGLGEDLKPVLGDLMKLALDAAPAVADAFVFIVKIVAAAVRGLAGFAQVLSATVSAVAQLANGSNAGIDGLGNKLGKIIDATGDSIFGKGGLFGEPVARPAFIGPPAPPGGAAGGNVDVGGVSITVKGGPTNADTGRAVAGAVRGALSPDTLKAATAALKRGASDDE